MAVEIDNEKKLVSVKQQIIFKNQTQDTLTKIVLNDWNNALSSNESYLGKRFSDEFVRSYFYANNFDKGFTFLASATTEFDKPIEWKRLTNQIDLIEIIPEKKINPNDSLIINLNYKLKIPSDQFTGFGFNKSGEISLKDCFILPARYENHQFVTYSNANVEDYSVGIADYQIQISTDKNSEINSDLDESEKVESENLKHYTFSGKNRLNFIFYLQNKDNFISFKNNNFEVLINFNSKIDDVQKAIIIDKISEFAKQNIGEYPFQKIVVSQNDYDRNPVYGLNQLPKFLRPFANDFIFELQFLKTYTNNYLKTTLGLNQRTDNWIFDGIQVYLMMKYIDENYPESKMMGNLARLKILKSFKLINLDFNEQYNYYYLLMARKNLDQPLSETKDNLIRFNERIASKYKAGLSFKYLDAFLNNNIVPNGIKEFYSENALNQISRADFESFLKSKTDKNIDWFFDNVIDSRNSIDYKLKVVSKSKDSVQVKIKNNSQNNIDVPIELSGISNKKVTYQKWFENIKNDSVFTISNSDFDRIALNLNNETPEFNRRNNWKSLKPFRLNRPIKFAFLKDIEDPKYNQILYVPTVGYNLYDGISPGLRVFNTTILNKPFEYDINPMYSTKAESLSGNFFLGFNNYIREGRLFNYRAAVSGSYFHYAPDAAYVKLTPFVTFSLREKNLRSNYREGFSARYSMINREQSQIIQNQKENYSVLGLGYYNSKNEISRMMSFGTGVQLSSAFGNVSTSINYRKLFQNNRQFNIRLFAGTFLYNNTTSDAYSFGISRTNDYLFDYNLIGRSETTGLFSQQYIYADAGFKSYLQPAFANQFVVSSNINYTIWNWIDVYGDIGVAKSKTTNPDFLYDNGIRLNFVQDFFELYLPVYSNNGWEIAQPKYGEKIRFIVTFSPKTLLNLFTRKWF